MSPKDEDTDTGLGQGYRKQIDKMQTLFLVVFWRRGSCKSATNAALPVILAADDDDYVVSLLLGDSFCDFSLHFGYAGIFMRLQKTDGTAKWKCLGKIFASASVDKFAYL